MSYKLLKNILLKFRFMVIKEVNTSYIIILIILALQKYNKEVRMNIV